MTRTLALSLLRPRSKAEPVRLAPVRIDCRDGKCGRCHSCRQIHSVPVALQKGGAR
jgi:hypothetical protein